MSSQATQAEQNQRTNYDPELIAIADYVLDYNINSDDAYETARLCLMDTLGCGILALNFQECRKMLGPIVPGMEMPNGVVIPGTGYRLDPVQAAFNIGAMIRWLDFNDTWLAAEWGHPSDNLGGILAVCDYISRKNIQEGKKPLVIKEVLTAMIKAHEIQGCLALENSFNRVGLDHVVLVKVATTAVVTALLGGDRDAILRALSQAWVDGQSLRTYRHAPNAGSRKSWAAGDATSRGVRLAMMSLLGEMGYPSVLSAPTWGFYDVFFKGKSFQFQRPYGSYVMENVLFKIAFPAEFHAQTAVECAVKLHPAIIHRLEDIETIAIYTHESAIRIISKEGPLHNPADRDHCIQYMSAIGLLFGDLKAEHYEEETAKDPRVDQLREKMRIAENKDFTKDYLDPTKRSIANTMQIFFTDGTSTEAVTVEYPIGHKRRRQEGIPVLEKKFVHNLNTQLPEKQTQAIFAQCNDVQALHNMSVDAFMDLWRV